jgi:hypothetical protein
MFSAALANVESCVAIECLSTMGLNRVHTRCIVPVALLLLLFPAVFGHALIRIVSPVAPSVGQLTCRARVVHVRAAVASSSSLSESAQIAFLVDGQQHALVAARSNAEVLFLFCVEVPFVQAVLTRLASTSGALQMARILCRF